MILSIIKLLFIIAIYSHVLVKIAENDKCPAWLKNIYFYFSVMPAFLIHEALNPKINNKDVSFGLYYASLAFIIVLFD